MYYVRVDILLTCGKHLHYLIIHQEGGFLFYHEANFIYMNVWCIDVTCFCDYSIWFWNCTDDMLCFVFHFTIYILPFVRFLLVWLVDDDMFTFPGFTSRSLFVLINVFVLMVPFVLMLFLYCLLCLFLQC